MIDLETVKDACALVRTGRQRGTAYLVAPGFAVTCTHVVEGVAEAWLKFPSGERRCTVIARDEGVDCALLELNDELPGITPLLLDPELPLPDDRCWIYGFPALAVDEGKRIVGQIRDPRVRDNGHSGIDVYSDDASAGRGETLGGFSGSPVIVGGAVIGHLRNVLRDDGVAALGQIAACPAAQVLGLLPQSLRREIAERAAAQRAHFLPFATPIANFIAARLGSTDQPEPFGGRSHELRSLDEWCNDPNAAPYLLLTAPAGRGKSSLLVRWSERLHAVRAFVHILFVPVSVQFELNSASSVMQALATRLCAVHRETVPLPPEAPIGRWRDLVSRMLSRALPSEERLIAIVDGIDEALDWELGPGFFPASPARGVRVVLSAREQANRSGRQWLEHLNWADPTVGRWETLPLLDIEGMRDAIRSMGVPLAELADRDDTMEQLARLSEGDPLVLSLYIKHLSQGQSTGSTIGLEYLPQIAPGLDGYFDRWWDDQSKLVRGSPTESKLTRAAFNILATALAPLQRRELLGLLRRIQPDTDGDTLDAALVPCARFISHAPVENTYVLSHPRFGAHRFSRLKRDGDHSSYEAVFLTWGSSVLAQSTTATQPTDARYIVRFYLPHLKRSGAGPSDLLPLLGSAWRRAWNVTLPEDFGGHNMMVDEIWQILADADRQSVASDSTALFLGQQVRCALELAAHTSFSQSLPPAMVSALLRFRVWSGARAVQYADSTPNLSAKAEILTSSLPYLEGPDLLAAEQRVVQRQLDGGPALMTVLPALCRRLCQSGEITRAAELARTALPGYWRSCAMLVLAAAAGASNRHTWLADAFEGFHELSWLYGGRLIDQFSLEFTFAGCDALPGQFVVEEGTRQDLLSRVRSAVDGELNRPADEAALSVDVDCQMLKYLLPFLTECERAPYLIAFFRAVRAGSIPLFAIGTLWEVGPFVTARLAGEAMETISGLESGPERAGAVLAHWNALNSEQRATETPRIMAAARDVDRLSSINDRVAFFGLLAQHGFVDAGLDVIAVQRPDEWYTDTLVDGIVPFLSFEQTCRGLSLCKGMRPSVSTRSRYALLGRLAGFSQRTAAEALTFARRGEFGAELPTAITHLSSRIEAQTGGTTAGRVLDDLTALADPALRLESMRLAATYLTNQPGDRIAEAIASFGQNHRAAEALAILAEVVTDEDLFSEPFLGAVRSVTLHVPSEHKAWQLVPFFRKAIGAGYGVRALEQARALGSNGFAPPILAAAFAVGDSEIIELAAAAKPLADNLRDPWDKLAALAALKRAGLDVELTWRDRLEDLLPIEVTVRATGISNFLRQLPTSTQTDAFDEISARSDLSLDRDNYSDYAAIRDLCKGAHATWLLTWGTRLGNHFSASSRNELRAAFAERLAEVGLGVEALKMASHVSDSDMKAEAMATILPLLPEALVLESNAFAARLTPAGRLRIWCSLLPKLPHLSRHTVHALLETSLRHAARSSLNEMIIDLWGSAGAIQRLGGNQALEDILSQLRQLEETHPLGSREPFPKARLDSAAKGTAA